MFKSSKEHIPLSQKAKGSIVGGQIDGGSVQSGVQGLHFFLCGGEQTCDEEM
mgnify:CR=1 FL=1